MKRIITLFSLVLALIIASTTCVLAKGDPSVKDLMGEWATIGMTSCVQADGVNKFGSDPQYQLLTPGYTLVWQSAGVLSLFGDGTGSWIGKNVMINNGAAVEANSYPVSWFTTDCDIAYQAQSDGTIKFAFDNCVSTFTAGQYGPETQAFNYHFTAEYARLSSDKATLVIWDLDPMVELTWTTTAGVNTYYNRICSRTGTAIRFR